MKKLLFVLALICLISSCNKTPVITLSVDKSEISATGEDIAKFTVICNDEEDVTDDCRIFFTDSKKELGATSFSSTEPKTYSFYATYEDAVSNNVTVEVIEVADDESEMPIELRASTDTIVANGTDAVTFTVMQDTADVTSSSEIFVNDNAIEGNVFTTKTSGSYTVVAKKNGTLVSNEIVIIATKVPGIPGIPDDPEEPEEPENPEVAKPITLSASTDTIVADGTDAVTFTVMQENENVTSSSKIFVNDDAIEGNVFTTKTAGSYTFVAKKNDTIVSNKIVVIAKEVAEEPEEPEEPEKPIELTANKTELKANGIDAITFTVTQEGNDVTSQSEIYVNDGRLNGNKFTTYTAGSYNIYAKKNGVVSNEITVTAEAVESGTTVVFAEGVTTTSGWYDVNKLIKGGGDTQMCWAASAANMIQWWQDRYVAAGNSLPAGAVTGTGTKTYDNGYTYNLALMELYRDSWTELHWGSYPDHAVIWYFEGRNVYSSFVNCSQPSNSTGGYYANIWSQILTNTYNGYSNGISGEINNYYEWGNGSGLNAQERLKKFSDYVVESIDKGVTSLTISLNSNGGLLHATTLWGYEIDNATGMLTKIWLTDSDDIHQGNTSGNPTQQMLREYSVSYDSSCNKVKFTGEPYGSCWAISLYPVSGYKKN